MSSTDFSSRKYSLSDTDLAVFANTLVFVMSRDIDEFEVYGVSNDSISDLEDMINDFQEMPDDEINRTEISEAVEARENLRNSILNTMRGLSARAKAIFGDKSAKYRSLSPGAISQLSENNLLAAARQVHTSAENNLSALESEGVSEDYLNNFNATINDYEDAINNVNNKKIMRDDATELKIIKGNELYSYVVKYCNYGKIIWGGVSAAKYNDYVIYSAGTGGSGSNNGGGTSLAAPTSLRYDFAGRTVIWNTVSGATSYQLEFSIDNEDWSILYDDDGTEFFSEELFPDHCYFRVKAKNANYNSSYTTYNLVYNYNLNGPANLTHIPSLPGFTWNPVPGATAYQVEIRPSDGSDDDYYQIYFGNDTTLVHADPVGTYFVKVRSLNENDISGWMLLAYNVGV